MRLLRLQYLGHLLVAVMLVPQLSSAQYERPGSSTAQFLDIGVSPRAEGMAGAYVSVAEGAEGAYYNPAVMARTPGTNVAISFTRWFAEHQPRVSLPCPHVFGRPDPRLFRDGAANR